jgi:hypothetical protein
MCSLLACVTQGKITERLKWEVKGLAPFGQPKYLRSNPSGDKSSNLGDINYLLRLAFYVDF